MSAAAPTTPRPDLIVDGLSVRFGGLTAVSELSLHARSGRITGLIGPNGAGKSTTFNACTGMVQPSTGVVQFAGKKLNGMSSAHRARAGLGRTFQRMQLWKTMTVLENVTAGREALLSSRRPWGQLVGARGERADALTHAHQALDQCGIADLRDALTDDLSTGQRRLVELARAIATGFQLLLLDEPSSGLNVSETSRFGDILENLAHEQGIGILLVEHDMALVRRVCEYIYVLDFGKLIHEGDASDVLNADVVRAAYLGSEGAMA